MAQGAQVTAKVLHLHFGKEGGSERFFFNLVEAFEAAGLEQRFVTRPDRAAAVARYGPVIRSHYRRASPLRPYLTWRVHRMVARWQPDAVMAWMSRAARLLPPEGAATRIVRLGEYPRHLKNFGQTDVIVGNAPGVISHMEGLGWTGRTALVSNFVRDVVPEPVSRAALETPEDAFVVIGVGRLSRVKGFDVLIEAVAARPGAWLWLVGAGDQQEALEAQAAALGIADRVRFIGWVEEPIHYVAAADVFVMPSRHEPLGNVLLEAWRARVPTITTASEGPSWFATDGADTLVVPIDGVEGLTDALARVQSEPGLAARLVEGGSATLAARFTQEAVVAQYLELMRGSH